MMWDLNLHPCSPVGSKRGLCDARSAQAEEHPAAEGALRLPAPWEGEQGYVPMSVSAGSAPRLNRVISCV